MQHDFALTMEEDTVTPLRPVTTRWLPPTAAEEGVFARPFVPRDARQGPRESADRVAAPPPEDTLPVQEETLPGAEAAPDEGTRMPWEEEPSPWFDESPDDLAEAAGHREAPAPADTWADGLPADSGRAAPPWADERPEVEDAAEPDRPFPLEAFLIPENTTRLPAGLENDRELQDRIAAEVADALSTMVARLRADGLDALLTPSARREPVDVVLAAVLSGYLSRRAS